MRALTVFCLAQLLAAAAAAQPSDIRMPPLSVPNPQPPYTVPSLPSVAQPAAIPTYSEPGAAAAAAPAAAAVPAAQCFAGCGGGWNAYCPSSNTCYRSMDAAGRECPVRIPTCQ